MVLELGAGRLSTLAFVPARGGSKGIPQKNLAVVGGLSLVARAILVATEVQAIDEVVVSSDDANILDEARAHGAMTDRRRAELSTDETPTLAVLVDFLFRQPEVDTLVVLQPTSPLRNSADVGACLDRLSEASTVATVSALGHPPEWSFLVDAHGHMEPLLGWSRRVSRRQDSPSRFRLNGAVYAARADHLRGGGRLVDQETLAVVMPEERSIDIDSAVDLSLARLSFDRLTELEGGADSESPSGA